MSHDPMLSHVSGSACTCAWFGLSGDSPWWEFLLPGEPHWFPLLWCALPEVELAVASGEVLLAQEEGSPPVWTGCFPGDSPVSIGWTRVELSPNAAMS